MAYLGKANGPRLSEILARNREMLLREAVKRRGDGPPRLSPKTIDNLIAQEIEEEAKGIVAPAGVPRGYGARRGEFFYRRLDIETDAGIDLFYGLTKQERKLLGDDYKFEHVELISPHEAEMQERARERIRGSGEFDWQG